MIKDKFVENVATQELLKLAMDSNTLWITKNNFVPRRIEFTLETIDGKNVLSVPDDKIESLQVAEDGSAVVFLKSGCGLQIGIKVPTGKDERGLPVIKMIDGKVVWDADKEGQ